MASGPQALAAAYVQLRSGHLQSAEQLLRDLVQVEPNYGDAWGFLGIALGQQDKLEESIPCFRRSLQLRPDSFENQTGGADRQQSTGPAADVHEFGRPVEALREVPPAVNRSICSCQFSDRAEN
jgi:tetratricopeptide (TPR) repeat protein